MPSLVRHLKEIYLQSKYMRRGGTSLMRGDTHHLMGEDEYHWGNSMDKAHVGEGVMLPLTRAVPMELGVLWSDLISGW